MQRSLSAICVFCASGDGHDPAYLAAARQVAGLLARQGVTVVYGGGRVGLMGAVADAAIAAGGRVIGVIPELLMAKERGHKGVTELHVVQTMHQRKALMADRADGFLALPGGLGTLEEICEVLTWAQLGIHKKPCAILNVNGFYDHLVAFLDHATGQGLIRPENRALLLVDDDAERLLHRMQNYTAPERPHWMGQAQV